MVKLEHSTPNGQDLIERACRTCYSSWHRYKPPISTIELIEKVIKKKHLSVLEHASATFRITGSRVMTHEIVRHRLMSFSQESQRYCIYADKQNRKKTKDFEFKTPPSISNGTPYIKSEYNKMIQWSYELYETMLEKGIPPEDARFILPNATLTEIVVSGNLRAWRELLTKRCHPRAMWEIRNIANEIKDTLIDKFPSVFFDFKKGEMTEEDLSNVN